jgi:hypothetical protein
LKGEKEEGATKVDDELAATEKPADDDALVIDVVQSGLIVLDGKDDSDTAILVVKSELDAIDVVPSVADVPAGGLAVP